MFLRDQGTCMVRYAWFFFPLLLPRYIIKHKYNKVVIYWYTLMISCLLSPSPIPVSRLTCEAADRERMERQRFSAQSRVDYRRRNSPHNISWYRSIGICSMIVVEENGTNLWATHSWRNEPKVLILSSTFLDIVPMVEYTSIPVIPALPDDLYALYLARSTGPIWTFLSRAHKTI